MPAKPTGGGALIINADDWGRNTETTDRTLECVLAGAVSSVSAMMFMEDSERAAGIARERGIDAGLHLNFTLGFSGNGASRDLLEHQQQLSRFLRMHRFAPVLFHPGLIRSFEYVFAAQHAEFVRLYGAEPARLDGHHHMHLCSNVLLGGLLPASTVVRRSFSFEREEKSAFNRFYRRLVDQKLAQRHRTTDFFFSLPPLQPPVRLQKILRLCSEGVVEVETHPVNPEEYQFLVSGEIFCWTRDVEIAPSFSLRQQSPAE